MAVKMVAAVVLLFGANRQAVAERTDAGTQSEWYE